LSVSSQHDGAIPAATSWVEAALTGSVATSVAILAVAALGIGMLWGRVDLRSVARVTLGAFILFGAPLLAYQLTFGLRGGGAATPDMAVPEAPISAAPAIPKNAPVNDPYAGAAVPQLQQ
jgi:type IV secretory pathway VirB2 component (pilin)